MTIPLPAIEDRRCVCGHLRSQHAWGLAECEDIFPPRVCELGCMKYREVWP